jgi:hypothetical protein
VDLSDVATGRESDGDRGRGDVFGEFRDGEDIVGIEGKEGGLNFSPKGFEGAANGFEAVPRIFHHMGPRIVGEADLMTKVGHGISFSGGLAKGFCDYALAGDLLSSKK